MSSSSPPKTAQNRADQFMESRPRGAYTPRAVVENAWELMMTKAKSLDPKDTGIINKDGLIEILAACGSMDRKEAQWNADGYFRSIGVGQSEAVLVPIKGALEEWKRMQLFKAMRKMRDNGEMKQDTFSKEALVKNLQDELGNEAEKTCDAIFKAVDVANSGVLQLKDIARYYFQQQLVYKDRTAKNRNRSMPLIPLSVLTDSYKAGHFLMYPDAEMMVAYGEFRRSFMKDKVDNRFVFYGIRYIIENFIAIQWTEDDVERADMFYRTHNVGFTPYPYPKDLFLKFVRENNGYFPVTIEALPEGTCANIHVPVYQIFAKGEYARLITFLETILTQVWYPSNVATLSRRTKDIIEEAFDKSVDDEMRFLVDGRLHDFGFRGSSCVEASVVGGLGHLLNFTGSDTMSAAYYAQFHLNDGRPVANALAATEHSVMTSWENEKMAIRNMIQKFGGENKVFGVVMDSYNYNNALDKILPQLAEEHKENGGLMVLRPDSGDPVECIIKALTSGEATFGANKNKKGFKVLNNVAAIQGDGIGPDTIVKILKATLDAGYSAQNVAFGMGGGLLQRHDRDTMSFATKLSYVLNKDGSERLVMKKPKTDSGKISFPGILKVIRVDGQLSILPRTKDEPADPDNELKVVYDMGPVPGVWDDFDTVKARVQDQWSKVEKGYDPASPALKQAITDWIADHDIKYAKMMEGSQ